MSAPAMLLSPPPDSQAANGSPMAGALAMFSHETARAMDALHAGIAGLKARFPQAPFDPAAIAAMLAAPLPQQILMMAARVLVLELNVARLEGRLSGNTPEQRFASFVESLANPTTAAALRAEYSVLCRQVLNLLNRWVAYSLEFLNHLCEDWQGVQNFFESHPGHLEAIDSGAGDRHRGGRSVIIARFSSGGRIVYKPRSLAVDEHFQQLVEWLNAKGSSPPLRTLRVWNRGDYGWCEFISNHGCRSRAELERFYQRQGACLAILYALNASDFHCENTIAAGEHPVLIDLEALFDAREGKLSQSGDPATSGLLASVVNTGLLPTPIFGAEGVDGVDLSGLTNPAGQLSPTAAPDWESVGTDEMHLIRRRMAFTGTRNCPTFDGAEARALDYSASISSGFSSTYRLLMKHSAEMSRFLERFAQDEVRFIARATRTYGVMLQESFHPDVLRNHQDRLNLFANLRDAVSRRPSLQHLVDAEIEDLDAGDIPLFTARPSSPHLWTSAGRCIPGALADTPLALAKDRLATLSEADLARQLWLVRASLATTSREPSIKTARASTDRLLDRAMAAGDRLIELAHRDGGRANWLGLISQSENRWRILPLAHDFYDGLPGVLLFLGYLNAVTGEDRYRDLAACGLNELRADLDSMDRSTLGVGGFTGRGGLVYALCHLSSLFRDQSLRAAAEKLLESAHTAIAQDRSFDVLAGSAGFALALESLRALGTSADVTRLQRACGRHLQQHLQHTAHGAGWLIPSETVPLAGFAHGNAGIAYALLQTAAATGEESFRETALAAMAYERAIYSPERGNWLDLRAQCSGADTLAWCHGAPGIALARLSSLPLLPDPLLAGEIEAALKTTATRGFGNSHVICHGDLGNADILLEAARVLGQPAWKQHALRELARILGPEAAANWRFDNALDVDNPGFMTGLAGIGYALLRFAAPDRVPCALALQPPKVQ